MNAEQRCRAGKTASLRYRMDARRPGAADPAVLVVAGRGKGGILCLNHFSST